MNDSFNLLGFMFFMVCISYGTILVYALAYNGTKWVEEIGRFIINLGIFVTLVVILVVWAGTTEFTTEQMIAANNTTEALVIYTLVISPLAVVASIISLYVSGGHKIMASTLILLSFLSYGSATMAKFYYVDIYIQRVVNKCEIINEQNRLVCEVLNVNNVIDKYAASFATSTATACAIILLLVFYFPYAVRKFFHR